jgi:hypothetical protein
VLFVEVDNHTEPPAVVAAKIERYRKFFQRQVKDHRGRDVAMRSTLWEDSDRGGFPPVALVFTKNVGPDARMNRMKAIRDASRPCWEGQRQTEYDWSVAAEGEERDGWRSFDGTVPVIATHLEQLKAKGPHGAIWWRFGHSEWQTLTDALTNTNTHDDYLARDEQRRQEREAVRAHAEQRQPSWDEQERRQTTWACPSCGMEVSPGTVGAGRFSATRGGDPRRAAGSHDASPDLESSRACSAQGLHIQ